MVEVTNEAHRSSTSAVAPLGISVSIGAAAVVVAAFGGALVPRQAASMQWLLLAAVVAGFAFWAGDAVATVLVAALAFVLADGFLVNRLGELSWHGRPDLWRVGVLVAAAGLGLSAGRIHAHRPGPAS